MVNLLRGLNNMTTPTRKATQRAASVKIRVVTQAKLDRILEETKCN